MRPWTLPRPPSSRRWSAAPTRSRRRSPQSLRSHHRRRPRQRPGERRRRPALKIAEGARIPTSAYHLETLLHGHLPGVTPKPRASSCSPSTRARAPGATAGSRSWRALCGPSACQLSHWRRWRRWAQLPDDVHGVAFEPLRSAEPLLELPAAERPGAAAPDPRPRRSGRHQPGPDPPRGARLP